MFKEIAILESHHPSPEEVIEYIHKWNKLEDYVNQEQALDKLFLDLCPQNKSIEDILIKCSALNDFYSTNIFKVHNVAKHYLTQNIDERLKAGDLSLVSDLAHIEINGKPFYFYSFASKFCSHHRPDIYPIYDSYVHKLLKYFKGRDKFCKFKEAELKEYQSYYDIIQAFKKFYDLESFTVKEIDKYLWQLGKEAFNPYKSREEYIQRGEEILKQLEIDSENSNDEEKRMYACEIIHSISLETYDVPIKRDRMCVALAQAEEQGKKVIVVPNKNFQSEYVDEFGITIQRNLQLDGWRYHPEIVPKDK